MLVRLKRDNDTIRSVARCSQKSLSTFYGNEYVLFFSWDSKNSNDVNLTNSEPEVREDSKDADKVVEKIIEEFDGEILR